MLQITLSRQADKALRSMQPKQAARVREAIRKLAEDPGREDLDIKALVNHPFSRLRVGDWRVIFDQDGRILAIHRIAPRGSAYRVLG